MSSSNGNGNDAQSPPLSKEEKRQAYQDEAKLAKQFMNVFQNKLDQMRLREARSGDQSTFELGEEERKMLLSVNNLGLAQGVAGGLLAFAFLRRVRSHFLKRLIQQRDKMMHPQPPGGGGGGGSSGYGFGGTGPRPGTSSSSSTSPHVQNSPFQQGSIQQPHMHPSPFSPPPVIPPNLASNPQFVAIDRAIRQRTEKPFSFVNLFGWFLDTTVAFSVAVSVSIMFTDRQTVLNTLANIPLTPGRSRVSDEFCPELILEAQRLANESSLNKQRLEHPQTPYLKALMEFCTNCRQRQIYERKIRQEQGYSVDAPVSIPPPGVPKQQSFEEDSLFSPMQDDRSSSSSSSNNDDDDDEDGGLSLSDGFKDDDTIWTDQFVTDQEDDDKRRR